MTYVMKGHSIRSYSFCRVLPRNAFALFTISFPNLHLVIHTSGRADCLVPMWFFSIRYSDGNRAIHGHQHSRQCPIFESPFTSSPSFCAYRSAVSLFPVSRPTVFIRAGFEVYFSDIMINTTHDTCGNSSTSVSCYTPEPLSLRKLVDVIDRWYSDQVDENRATPCIPLRYVSKCCACRIHNATRVIIINLCDTFTSRCHGCAPANTWMSLQLHDLPASQLPPGSTGCMSWWKAEEHRRIVPAGKLVVNFGYISQTKKNTNPTVWQFSTCECLPNLMTYPLSSCPRVDELYVVMEGRRLPAYGCCEMFHAAVKHLCNLHSRRK